MKSHRELDVWQVSMELVMESYRIAHRLPKHEQFGLSSQIRRASISVPANIAEGYGRLHRGDYLHQLSFALGSLREHETLIEIIARLGYVGVEDLGSSVTLADRVGRMLHRLTTRLKSTNAHVRDHSRALKRGTRTPDPRPRS